MDDSGAPREWGRGAKRRIARGEEVKCVNCRTSETPRWRAGPEAGTLLCNACGLYLVRNGTMKPTPALAAAGSSGEGNSMGMSVWKPEKPAPPVAIDAKGGAPDETASVERPAACGGPPPGDNTSIAIATTSTSSSTSTESAGLPRAAEQQNHGPATVQPASATAAAGAGKVKRGRGRPRLSDIYGVAGDRPAKRPATAAAKTSDAKANKNPNSNANNNSSSSSSSSNNNNARFNQDWVSQVTAAPGVPWAPAQLQQQFHPAALYAMQQHQQQYPGGGGMMFAPVNAMYASLNNPYINGPYGMPPFPAAAGYAAHPMMMGGAMWQGGDQGSHYAGAAPVPGQLRSSPQETAPAVSVNQDTNAARGQGNPSERQDGSVQALQRFQQQQLQHLQRLQQLQQQQQHQLIQQMPPVVQPTLGPLAASRAGASGGSSNSTAGDEPIKASQSGSSSSSTALVYSDAGSIPSLPHSISSGALSSGVPDASAEDSAVPSAGPDYDPYENRGPPSVSSVSSLGSLGSFHSLMRAIAREKDKKRGSAASVVSSGSVGDGRNFGRDSEPGSHPAVSLLQTSMQPVVGDSMFHERFTSRCQSPRANRYYDEQNIILERLMALAQGSSGSSAPAPAAGSSKNDNAATG